jgi:hypothetical protein
MKDICPGLKKIVAHIKSEPHEESAIIALQEFIDRIGSGLTAHMAAVEVINHACSGIEPAKDESEEDFYRSLGATHAFKTRYDACDIYEKHESGRVFRYHDGEWEFYRKDCNIAMASRRTL